MKKDLEIKKEDIDFDISKITGLDAKGIDIHDDKIVIHFIIKE